MQCPLQARAEIDREAGFDIIPSFFGPFYGGYHVAALDPDYQWALVVGPDRSYCWILSRTKQLPPGVREQLIARANALGIDTQALIWVTHERTDPQP